MRCDWDTAAELVASCRIPVILAGGISAGNVAEGIRRVRPAGVDSCTLTNAHDKSGAPIRFKKNLQKVKQLVNAVRVAEKTLKWRMTINKWISAEFYRLIRCWCLRLKVKVSLLRSLGLKWIKIEPCPQKEGNKKYVRKWWFEKRC